METLIPIEYHRARDFSRKMNVTFEFVKQNWKGLGASIAVIAGPPVVVAGLIFGSFFGDIFNMSVASVGNPDAFNTYFLSVTFWLQMIIAFLFLVMSMVMTLATINNYLLLYGERRSNQIQVREVWERVRKTFGMYFSTTLLFGLCALALYILMVIPAALVASVSPWIIGLVIFGIFMLFIYLMFACSLVYVIRAYEHIGFFEAIRRSLYLTHGKWWSTFGLTMVLYFIMMMVSYIPMIPWYIITFASMLHNVDGDAPAADTGSTMQVAMMLLLTVYYLFQMILSSLPNVGLAFQYFNLVEAKESKGLLSQIDNFGEQQPPASSSEEQY